MGGAAGSRAAGSGAAAGESAAAGDGGTGSTRPGMPGWMRFGAQGAAPRTPDPEMEKQVLKNQAEALQSEIDVIKKRLSEIEGGAGEGA